MFETKRGNPQILYKNNLYVLVKQNDPLKWRCKGNKCTHRIFTDINSAPINVQENTKQHTAHQKVSQKEVMMLDSKLYLKECFFSDPCQPPRKLINRTLRHTCPKYQQTESTSFNTKDLLHLSQYIQRLKQLFYGSTVPKDAPSLRNFLIHFKEKKRAHTITSRNEEFIHIENDFIFLTTKTNLENLAQCHLIMGDGTFRYCPRPFTQMYTLHGFKENHFFPGAFIFLEDKSEETYKKMFNALNSLCNKLCDKSLNPATFVLDFELAAINSIKSNFEHSKIKACRFHLIQNWFKKIKKNHILKYHYESESEVGKWLKCHFGLPFLPPNLVPRAFKELSKSRPIQDSTACSKFTDYILVNYVQRGADKMFKETVFAPELWSGEPSDPRQTGEREIRTSNACEAFHRYFNEVFSRTHPSFLTVLHELLYIQEKTYCIFSSINEGIDIKNYSLTVNKELSIDVFNKFETLNKSDLNSECIRDYLFDVACRVRIYVESKINSS